MMLFQDYPFVHKHFHIPFNYNFLLGLNSWLQNVHISAFWGLREMCKCFSKATVNAGNYSQSSSGLGGGFIETSRLGGTEGGSEYNPKDAQEVDSLFRNSCGDQKMLQTECFSHPARWI